MSSHGIVVLGDLDGFEDSASSITGEVKARRLVTEQKAAKKAKRAERKARKARKAAAAAVVGEREAAVQVAADMMHSASEDDAWEGFSCTEVDGIVRMLAVHGHRDAAAAVIVAHSGSDDDGDSHAYIRAAASVEQYEAAVVYVRRISGEPDAQPDDEDVKRDQLRYHEEHLLQLRCELGINTE